jgi:hypothetical protein
MKTLICLMLLVMIPVKSFALGLGASLLIGAGAVATTALIIHESRPRHQVVVQPAPKTPATYQITLSGQSSLESVVATSSWSDACSRFTNSIQSQYPGRVLSISCGAPTVQTSPNPRAVGIYADPLYTEISSATYTVLI